MNIKLKSLKRICLDDSLQYIKGVGPKKAALLKKLQLETAADALFFLPFRYDDRSQIKQIADLTPGEIVSFTGTVTNAGIVHVGRRRKIFEAVVKDCSGFIRVKWFQFNKSYMIEKIKVGR